MIISSSFLKNILGQVILNDSPFLEFVISDDILTIGANYDDKYYISYEIEILNNDGINIDNIENVFIIFSPKSCQKICQLVKFWPKSKIQINQEGEHQTIEVVENGYLLRENPVQVDCVFNIGDKDYILEKPTMESNCSVNSKNIRQMLEFCQVQQDGVIVKLVNDKIIVSNEYQTIATSVDVDNVFKETDYEMKLSGESNKMIISFLSKLDIKHNITNLIFLEKEYAFSILITNKKQKIQLFTIHEITGFRK